MKNEIKIVVLDGYPENPGDLSWEGLERLGNLTVYDRTAPQQVNERIAGAQAILVNKTPIDRNTMQANPTLRYIGVLATGFNIIDIGAASEKNISVTNIPTYGTQAVAQMAFALLLEICHHVGHHDQAVRQGRWNDSQTWSFWEYPLIELADKTLGVIGLGRIGKATAKIAQAFGMQVIAYDHSVTDPEGVARIVSLDEVLANSDVISLHCPLTPETNEIINRDSIAKMKTGVILINTSRGALIDEQALYEALASEKVAAAGVDVVSQEPIAPHNPLLKAPNCIITPHIAWAPKESRQRLMDVAVNNLAEFLKGNPVNVINERSL